MEDMASATRRSKTRKKAISQALAVGILAIILVGSISAIVFLNRVSRSVMTSATTTTQSSLITSTATEGSSTSAFFTLTSSTSTPFKIQQYDTAVPATYQQTYTQLSQSLEGFDLTLNSSGPFQAHPITFGTELLAANDNRGSALLAPGVLKAVNVSLDALQALGVDGVTIALQYPLFTPSFPNYTQYHAFYVQVAQMVHARGMKLDIEAHVLFANSPFSPVKFNYSSVPYSKYVTLQTQMDQTIINDLHPDWIDIGVEPDTWYFITGYSQLSTPSGWNDFVESIVGNLSNGSTTIAAGAAAWDGPQWLQGYVSDPRIDVITTHIYPIYGNNFQNLIKIAQTAQQNHKRLIIDEMWETKSVGNEAGYGSIAADVNIYRRDVYGFWSPVDEQFIKEMVKFAELYPVDYISPYWSWYFFGYLNYSASSESLTWAQITSMLNQQAAQNILNGAVSPTGAYYGQIIRQYG
ncbi:MAG: hypothetical protein LYZ69_07795 [Nitrososphaerales archaeon]|nr:hypothetical protein [Nitrososphaerales archaeon]